MMGHVEIVAALGAFGGLFLAWFAMPAGVRVPHRASGDARRPSEAIAA